MVFYVEIGLNNIIFEGDAKSTIDEVHTAEKIWVPYRHIIQEVKSIDNSRDNWAISFTQKEGNKMARLMAKFAMSIYKEPMWLEEIASCISTCVLIEKLCMETC